MMKSVYLDYLNGCVPFHKLPTPEPVLKTFCML